MQDRRTVRETDAGVPDDTGSDRGNGEDEEARRRRRFAESLAKSAFGRHYWNDRLQTELRLQMKNSKQRPKRT